MSSIRKVQPLVDDLLHALRSGLDTEEEAATPGPSHQLDQFVVNAVGASAAAPGKLLVRSQHGFTKEHNAFAVYGKHVVYQVERVDSVGGVDSAHLRKHPLRALQAEATAKEIVGGAESAGERAATS